MMEQRRFSRRKLFSWAGGSLGVLLVEGCNREGIRGLRLVPQSLLGNLRREEGQAPIPGAVWLVAEDVGDGLEYRFPPGTLAKASYLTCDMLVDGLYLAVFDLALMEGEEGKAFHFRFGALHQCSLRVRMPLNLVDQNRWGIDREGAFLKPRCSGDRVDLAKVDRMRFTLLRKSPQPVRWCMTNFIAAETEPPRLARPVLPKGPLLDELGQSRLHEWTTKTRSVEELKQRLQQQLLTAQTHTWPESFTRWGGWKVRRLTRGTGFFSTHHDGRRWWLVDPDGYAFWSVGLDCVRVDTTANYEGLEDALSWLPDPTSEFGEIYQTRPGPTTGRFINYLAANFIRTFGPQGWRDKWAQIAFGELRRLGFNTVGNWSEWEYARQARFPYVRPLSFQPSRVRYIFRDFPDVFHRDFALDAADYANQLKDTVEDPALVGYFLMNEPQWGFARDLPAVGMLFNTPECATRQELARWLRERYPDAAALSRAWGIHVTFEHIAAGPWTHELTPAALKDLEVFSARMVEVYFKTLSEACRKVDPNHLNLGMRWAGIPPDWAIQGMKTFDVFSINCYRPRVPRDATDRIEKLLKMPVLIGEWHFGALDVGLPASGIGHVPSQADRGRAYRVYIEDAAANRNCVGAHWFTMYDQSALARFDGENYNIGFLDVCNRPYEPLCTAARASHERLYEVAAGRARPFNDAPQYLPNLY